MARRLIRAESMGEDRERRDAMVSQKETAFWRWAFGVRCYLRVYYLLLCSPR